MHERYTAAVIGGGVGGKLSAAALAASDRFELVGLADLRTEARAECATLYPGIATYATHQELFARHAADIVCVATYPPTHLPIALDALGLPLAGLLVEKPLGDTYAAGSAIVEQVKRRGLPLAVPHGLLVARHGREIIERVRGGEIGRLELVEIESTRWDIINAGIHWLNFFVALTDNEPCESVIAACDRSTRTYRDGMQVETLAVTYATTRSGVRVVMQTGDDVRIMRAGAECQFRIIGDAGSIEFYGWESTYRLVNAHHPNGERFEPPRNARTGRQLHLEQLAEQINRATPDYGVAETSLAALELCEAAYLSAERGCLVRLPLPQFSPPPPNDWRPGQPYAGSGGGRDGRKLP
jgi:predicted dehydrogenase